MRKVAVHSWYTSDVMTSIVSKSERLELRLFGTFEVRVAGQTVSSLRARKEQWLLALLALRHDRDVSRSWLASTLWPENDETQALFYLRKTLSSLRQTLGNEATRLQSPSKSTVRFDLSDAFCDVVVFDAATARPATNEAQEERLHEALSLYRGPLLEECTEEWITIEREARLQSYLLALENAAERALSRGEVAASCRWLRLALAAAPDRESTACALMQSLAASGDRAALRQVYQDLRLRLRETYNAPPSPETEALFKRLSQQEAQPALLPPAPATSSHRHLPVPLTDLIGREREIAEVKMGLERSRMMTLLGAGGVGKTRLSIAVADAALSRFADGVWFVDLAPLADDAYVAETVAQVLGVSQETGQSAEERLVTELSARSLLIVLDNCEHLLDASAALATRLLSACSQLRILATSRQALGVTGEQAYPVPSLGLPALSGADSATGALAVEKNPAFLLEYDGIQLFVQRALQANPAFRLDRRNALAVVEICQQLDGIPLAIELAAARLRSLSVGDVQARLADRFRLLNNGSRSALPRQQTLRAALDWSYRLLSPQEQALLNRLSLFAGGWTLEAAEKVCADDDADAWEVLDTLTALVEKSLVVYEQRDEGRYRLLETIRQYAGEKLTESGEIEAYRGRYCDYFVSLAQMIGPKLGVAEQVLWLDRLETEYDNLRTAISFCEKASANVQKGLLIMGSLAEFWLIRRHLGEARQFCATLLAREESPALTPARATVLVLAGNLAYCQGDNPAAQQLFEDALAARKHLGDRRGSIAALGSLGNIAHTKGDYVQARRLFEEALTLCRELGEVLNWEMVTLTCLGNVAFDQKDYAASRAYTEASLELCRKRGNRDTESYALGGLGRIALHQGVPADAIRFYEQALAIDRAVGNISKEASTLSNLGAAYAALGDIVAAGVFYCQSLSFLQEANDQRAIAPILETVSTFLIKHSPGSSESACRLFGAAEKLREDTSSPRSPSEQDLYDRTVPEVRQSLGDRSFSRAQAEGRTMTIMEAIAHAIRETEAAHTALTTR